MNGSGTILSAVLVVALGAGCASVAPRPAAQNPAPNAVTPPKPVVIEPGTHVVNIRAMQFQYVPNQIIVRQGEKVSLVLTSEDVTHGFAIDEYGINRTLTPRKTEVIEFVADKPGTFKFYCTVYCGPGHNNMKGTLIVLPAPKQTKAPEK